MRLDRLVLVGPGEIADTVTHQHAADFPEQPMRVIRMFVDMIAHHDIERFLRERQGFGVSLHVQNVAL